MKTKCAWLFIFFALLFLPALLFAQSPADSLKPNMPKTASAPADTLTAAKKERAVLLFINEGTKKQSTLHPDKETALAAISARLRNLQDKGFLTASADSLQNRQALKPGKPDTLKVTIIPGLQYRWAGLRPGNLAPEVLSGTGLRKRKHTGNLFSPSDLGRLSDRILTSAENSGYPFASLRLDSMQVNNSGKDAELDAAFNYKPGPYVVWDSLAIIGNLKVKRKFMSRLLRLRPGEAFNKSNLAYAEKYLRSLPWLKVTGPMRLTFSNNRAYPILSAENRNANQADGIIGFLPNEQGQGALLITGEINLKLNNLLQSGKALNLSWQSIKKGSQKLDVSYTHPALLGTPLEATGTFYLLKEDTTFLNRRSRLSLAWTYAGGEKLGVFAEQNASVILRQTTPAAVKGSTLPDISGYNIQSYGLSYEGNSTNDFLYPHSGMKRYLEVGIGTKTLQKLPGIPEAAYDTIRISDTRFFSKANIEHYTPLGKQGVLLTRLSGGLLATALPLRNELFRIGGLSTLRGFNENFFFASQYAIATAELRWFIEETSYLLLFADQGIYRYKAPGSNFTDSPTGIGAGISFSTPAGVFSFTYALGRTNSQKLGFNTSKVHFGLVGRF
ncbi:MAG: BamA/TamA family outer membrane protein [Bacteroidota bacterium]